MASISGLYVGVTGLNVSQAALNITSHNLANVETEGYVRQQAVLTDFNYKKLGDSYLSAMQQGLGANFATVKQVRDTFLDKAYRQEVGREAFYESQDDAVGEVEGFFGELEGESFQNTMNDLWTSLQELAKQPDSVVTRATLIQTAVSFVERTDNISDQLKDYQVNLNTQIQEQVDRINEIGKNLKSLNIKIRQYESTGLEKANDLRDQRNSLLDELGKLANITYRENPNGMVTVNLEGATFVTEDTVSEIKTVKMNETSDMIKPVWVAHGGADVFNLDKAASADNDTDIGSLKGLLTARGSKQASYTDIPIRSNYASETLYNADVRNYNNTINASVIMKVQAEFDQLVHGIVTTINDVLSPNKEVTQIDGSTIKILDTDKAPVGIDADSTMGEGLFNRKSMSRYSDEQEIQILDESGATVTITARVYNEEDPTNNYSLFTHGEIEVNPNIMQNYSYIPLSSNTGSGDFDVTTVNALLTKWQDTFSTLNPNTLTQNNFDDYYSSFISDLANRGEQLGTISTNQASMVESINNQRTEVTGVSSDEELTNMIKYQHAYNASARYVNVVSQMLEDIIEKL
jgi:flagellar hook-associated protein 1